MKILNENFKHSGILILRAGIGIMFIMHGFPKIAAGYEKWSSLGMAMTNLGISFAPAFWGFMAAFSEFGGGILLIIGFLTRAASGFMAFTMLVASLLLINKGNGVMAASQPIELFVVFLSLVFIGAGKFSLDYKFFSGKKDKKG
ncbi:MAG: DoxX family protein [Candidatus Omnitrophica bacterium]|nr:DoxX family protein [Candidatus Omnitrophota bacterium]